MTKSSTTFKFTDKKIGNLPPCPVDSRSKAQEYRDTQQPYLIAAVGKSTNGRPPHISFLVRIKRQGKSYSGVLGSFSAMNVDTARTRTQEFVACVEQGIDPRIKPEPEPTADEMTVREFVERHYKEWAEQNKRSANADLSKLNVHILRRWGDRPLKSITKRDVEQYLLDLSQQGKASGKPYKPATLNRHLSFISKLFGKAVEWDFLETNPAKGIKRKKENNIRTTHLKSDEMLILFDALDLDPNRIGTNALKLLALTGARCGEVLNALWSNYDERAATLYVQETKAGVGRFLSLNTWAVAIIEEMKRHKQGRYIFPGCKDPSKPYNNIKNPLARALKRAGLNHKVKGFTPHCLRHSYASLLATNGASLYQIQGLLGHATATVTQRYAHLCTDGLRATNQMVADVLATEQNVSSSADAAAH